MIVRYTRSPVDDAPQQLAPTSVNHRLSVLSSFFARLLARGDELGDAVRARDNPVQGPLDRPLHLAAGRDALRRERAELRRRVPVRLPRAIDFETAARLVAAAPTLSDRSILTVLWRTGARIGDWISASDRHGVLGLAVEDVDRKRRTICVRLKGSRDEHGVPVTDDFWVLCGRYLADERGETSGAWAWVGRRRGAGRPLRYDAFAAMLGAVSRRAGVNDVHAHMFRHGLADAVTATAGLQIAQQILGHQQLKLTSGHRKSTSPSTGSAENKSLADSRTSTRSPSDSPRYNEKTQATGTIEYSSPTGCWTRRHGSRRLRHPRTGCTDTEGVTLLGTRVLPLLRQDS